MRSSEALAFICLPYVAIIQVGFALEPPAISYCFSEENTVLTSAPCSPEIKTEGSKFRFREIYQNVINVNEPRTVPGNINFLILRCTAPYPIRWTAEKPLGSIRLVESAGNHGLNQNIGVTTERNFMLELLVRLKQNVFSMKLRCEGFMNSDSTFSEIYLNKPSRFLKSVPINQTRGNTLNFYNSPISKNGSNVRSTVPCVAKAISGYMRLVQPKIPDGAFDYIQLVVYHGKNIYTHSYSMNYVQGKAKQGKSKKFAPGKNYDPRIGFQVAASEDKTILDSIFSCDSTISPHSDIMVPVSSDQRISADLTYHNGTGGDSGVYCKLQNDRSMKLYIKHGMCHSILDCDLKWKPQAPHVFAVTNLSHGYQIVETEPYEQVFQPQPNGVKLEHNRGFVHCAGAFKDYGMNGRTQSLEFVSEMDYIFTGLDGMTYFFSENRFPNSAIIQMKKLNRSEDEKLWGLYSFECRISSFVLLPHIKFVIQLASKEVSILPGGKDRLQGAKITRSRTGKHRTAISWRLQLPVLRHLTKIRCDAPWMSTSDVASETWIATAEDQNLANEQRAADQSKLSDGVAVGISLAVIVVVTLICFLVIVWRKYKSAVKEIGNLTKAEVEEFFFGNVAPGQQQVDVPLESRPFLGCKIIKAQDLKTEKTVLGEGEFGIVHTGTFRGQEVAVKSTKAVVHIEYFKAFLKEIKVMAYIGEHENIILFHGAVVDRIKERQCSAVVELSRAGNLLNYLRANSSTYTKEVARTSVANITCANQPEVTLNHSTLISFCHQIAAGMEFLTGKSVLHGDLAARNILVFRDNVVKITDFGLSRKLYNCANYTKTNQKAPLPWRWMAIESLRFLDFSPKSDVWSFGVTMWEIFSMGQVPFSGVNWTTEFVDQLESGYRLMKPRLCTPAIFDWMMKCWSNQAEDRPTFTECKAFLSSPDIHMCGNVCETSF